jgi:hypothetical protein
VVHILDREIELVFMPLRVAAIFAAAVGQHAQELHLMAVEERDDAVVEEIGGGAVPPRAWVTLRSQAPRALAHQDRDAVYPNHARKIATAHAIQLSHSGIIRVPHRVVTAMGQPSTARASCKTAITAKTIAAIRA